MAVVGRALVRSGLVRSRMTFSFLPVQPGVFNWEDISQTDREYGME